MAQNKFDTRQTISYAALSMANTGANAGLNSILAAVDAEMAKLFEDRNILLTDGGLITFTGTDIQFTEALNIVLNSKISGAAPQVITLGSTTRTLTNGQMWYVVLDRGAGTATTTIASSLPAVTGANQEVFLIAKRVDAGDGTQRIYWRSGMGQNAGQTLRLGASGSGSGSGTGDDLGTLQFRASFTDGFNEAAAQSTSGVDSTATKTTAAYNAAAALYRMNYDASRTVTGTGTAMTLSGTPAYTIAIGDMLVVGTEARRITAVGTQTTPTIESAFTTNPSGAVCCVSQTVHTKDIYGAAIDGNSISTAFAGASMSEVMVDYEDTTTSGDAIFDINTTPVIAFSASLDNSTYSTVRTRPTNETDTVQSVLFSAAGTAFYIRFFANKTSGSGAVNVLGYRAFMQKALASAQGGVLNSSLAFTNGVGTPVNCSVALLGGKTAVTTTFNMAAGVQPGSPYGSVDVLLNGSTIPRFINATLTPDASYIEISPTVIQLDRDYSAQNLSVQIIQRNQNGYDSSTDNTTSLFNLNQNRFKNYIINGNMDFSQRGTSFSTPASATYTLDRWRVDYNGTIGAFTLSQQAFTLGQTDVPNEPTSFLRWNQTSAGSGSTARVVQQRIENVRTLAGKTITVTFYAKADTSRTVGVSMNQFFGTGGSPSADVLSAQQNVSLTAVWQKFTLNFSLPSISGKTIGTNANSTLDLALSLPLNTTMTIDLAQVMVNEGSVAAPWVYASGGAHLNRGAELALCQRYYQFDGTEVIIFGLGVAGQVNLFTQFFKVSMRAAPVVTVSAGTLVNVTSVTFDSNLTTGWFNWKGTVTAANTRTFAGNNNDASWTAESEL